MRSTVDVMAIPVEELFEQMRDDVVFLSSNGGDQVAWMFENHWDLDELVEIFCGSVVPGWFPRLIDAGLLSADAQLALLGLKACFDTLSNEADLWSDDGLRTDPRWDAIRAVARDVLVRVDRCRP